jgi:hypothetical protein
MNEIIVFITASKEDEAVKISRALVEARLAGCVNIIRNIRSIYSWHGKTRMREFSRSQRPEEAFQSHRKNSGDSQLFGPGGYKGAHR